jgi:hypothetical protein
MISAATSARGRNGCTFWFLGMYNPGAKGVRIGAARFEECGDIIFADGFESGNTSNWPEIEN